LLEFWGREEGGIRKGKSRKTKEKMPVGKKRDYKKKTCVPRALCGFVQPFLGNFGKRRRETKEVVSRSETQSRRGKGRRYAKERTNQRQKGGGGLAQGAPLVLLQGFQYKEKKCS